MGLYDGQLWSWPEGYDELLIGNVIVALFDKTSAKELDQLPVAQWRADAGAHANAGRVISLARRPRVNFLYWINRRMGDGRQSHHI